MFYDPYDYSRDRHHDEEKSKREKNLRNFHSVEASSEEQKLPPRVKDRTGEIRFKISFSSSSRGDELKEFNLDMLPRKYISGDLAKYNRLPFFNDQVDYSLATDQLKKFAYHELVEIFFVREAFVNFVLAKCQRNSTTSISNVGETAHENLIAMLTFLLPNLEKRVVEWSKSNESVLKTVHPTLFDIESDYVSRLMLDGNIHTVYNVQLLSLPERIDFYREYMVEMSRLVNWKKKNQDELDILKSTFLQEMRSYNKFDKLRTPSDWLIDDHELNRYYGDFINKKRAVEQSITNSIIPLLTTFKTNLSHCKTLYSKLIELRRNVHLLKPTPLKAIDEYVKKYYRIHVMETHISEYDKVTTAAAAAAANSSTTAANTTAFEIALKAAKSSSSSSSSSMNGRSYGYNFGRGGYHPYYGGHYGGIYDDDDDYHGSSYSRRRGATHGSFADIVATLYRYHKFSVYSNKNGNDSATLAMIGVSSSSSSTTSSPGGGSIMDLFDKYHTFLLRENVNGTTSSLKVSYIAYLNVDVVKGDVTPENKKAVSCFLQKNRLIAATDKFFAYAKNALNSSSSSSSYFKNKNDEAFDKRVFIDLSGQLEEEQQKRARTVAAAQQSKTGSPPARSTTMKNSRKK